MKELNIKEYYKTYVLYKKKKISEDEWRNFCAEYFEKMLVDNKDILKRLKECGEY